MGSHIIIFKNEDNYTLGAVLVDNYDKNFSKRFTAVLYGDGGYLDIEEKGNENIFALMEALYDDPAKQEPIVKAMKAKGYTISFVKYTELEIC